VVFEHTRNTIDAVKNIRVPVLILPAEKEELFPNNKNSELVYDMLKSQVPTDIDYLPGTHYDAYGGESYKKGLKRAVDWFTLYLGNVPPAKL
jgi:dipeptidyl aminopeptidase/acylaminoacyl peptidase